MIEFQPMSEYCIRQMSQWQTYQAQEQCILRADQPHGYRDEVGETRFIVVIHYPT